METQEHKGYTIELTQDPYPDNPRDWDNLGTMVCWHPRYILGDEQPKCDPTEYKFEMLPVLMQFAIEDNDNWAMGAKWLDKNYIMLDLHVYEHGGITMSTGSFSCPWDSGQVGFIYVSVEDIKKEYGWKRLTRKRRQLIESYLRNEVKTYAMYLEGDVWSIRITDPDGNEIEDCSGFYGYSETIDECKKIIDRELTQARAS